MKRVSVLMGGPSAEREVSLNSGANCAAALKEAGYKVSTIDVTRDLPALLKAIKAQKPDVLFNALHGRWVEDGNIQGILNYLGIPYTHSGLMASAIAMDKPMAKRLFAEAGLRCPKGVLLHKSQVMKGDPLPRPYVVKPANEGSSVGVQIITKSSNARPFDGIEWPYGEHVLCEEFIQGRELTVAVMGDRAMAVTELKVDGGFYDYAHKYTDGVTEHLCPAPLREDIARGSDAHGAGRAPDPGLPRRVALRLPLRRHQGRRRQQALSAGDQHPARHDRAVAGAGAGQASRHLLSRSWCPGWWSTPHATPRSTGGRRWRAAGAIPVTARTAVPLRKRPRPAWLRWTIRFGIGFGSCAVVGGGLLWSINSGWLPRELAMAGEAALDRDRRCRAQPADRRSAWPRRDPAGRHPRRPRRGARRAAARRSTSMRCASGWPPCPGSCRRRSSGAIPTGCW